MTPQFLGVKIFLNFFLLLDSSVSRMRARHERSVARPGCLACRGRSLSLQRILYHDRTLLSRSRLDRVLAQGVSPRANASPGLYRGSLCRDNEFLCRDRTWPSAHPRLSIAARTGTVATRNAWSRQEFPALG